MRWPEVRHEKTSDKQKEENKLFLSFENKVSNGGWIL